MSHPEPWWQCANVEHGQRCARAGSVSRNTTGGGPWYCAQHAFAAEPSRRDAELGRDAIAKLRASWAAGTLVAEGTTP
jgi:hypothetical protein